MKTRLLFAFGALFLLLPAARALNLPSAAEVRGAFDAIDADHDNSISLDEWEKASFAIFHAADKNNDNYLDLSEIAGTSITQDTFMLADEDHDGRLSISEFMRLRRAVFTAADIDRNDSLSFVEFELLTLLAQTGWTDRNHNGRIEPSELKAALAGAFSQLDVKKAGVLTSRDVAYMSSDQFQLCDDNKDGRLTQDEFVRGYLKALHAL